MKIAVLGAGMVGSTIAKDLAGSFEVTCFDRSEANLSKLKMNANRIALQKMDLSDYSLYPQILAPFDMVVLAVPGFMGYRALEQVILAGKNVVDISFFPEDALTLHQLAKEKGVTAIVDCGVAPGMSNLIIGRYDKIMKLDAFEIYVGGLPQNPKPPFLYKAPFSPIDVIEEYTRPARLMENGEVITKPALTDRSLMDFEGVGMLEAFNTDGLRTLLYTMPHIPNQKEQTLRHPGHLDLIIALQQSGFFSNEPIVVGELTVVPLEVTAKLLFDQWKLEPGEPELTVMQVTMYGEGKTIQYQLLDKYDAASETSSMSRSTGYTCSAAVHMLAEGLFTEKGLFPPEHIGANEVCFEYILKYLKTRNVQWMKTAL